MVVQGFDDWIGLLVFAAIVLFSVIKQAMDGGSGNDETPEEASARRRKIRRYLRESLRDQRVQEAEKAARKPELPVLSPAQATEMLARERPAAHAQSHIGRGDVAQSVAAHLQRKGDNVSSRHVEIHSTDASDRFSARADRLFGVDDADADAVSGDNFWRDQEGKRASARADLASDIAAKDLAAGDNFWQDQELNRAKAKEARRFVLPRQLTPAGQALVGQVLLGTPRGLESMDDWGYK